MASKGTWKGKPLDKCTKAELMVAVMELGRLLELSYQENVKQFNTVQQLLGIKPLFSPKDINNG